MSLTLDQEMAGLAQAAHRKGSRTGALVVATLSAGQMSSMTAESIAGAVMADSTKPERRRRICRDGGGTIFLMSGPRIAEARSQIVDKFLTAPAFEGSDWLLMVDSDMVFRPEDIDRILEVADPKERPIVGGLCFAGYTPATMYPTIYGAVRDADGKLEITKHHDYPRDQVVKVAATGAAFLLVHRQVFTAMSQPHPKGFGTLPNGTPNVYPWFVEGHTDGDGRPFGEDIAFCLRAGALGIPVHVHTGVRIGHHKGWVMDETLYDATQEHR